MTQENRGNSGFGAGVPELLILKLLQAREMYGYEIVQAIGHATQNIVRPGEGVFAEVISNLNIGDQVALSPTDEEALGRLGFDEPLAGASPNWSFHVDDGPGFVRLMGVMNRVIYQVLREVAGNAVEVRSWPAEVPSGMDTSDYRTLKRIYVEERQRECGAGDGDAPGPGESGS